jgi:hypothetical protein
MIDELKTIQEELPYPRNSEELMRICEEINMKDQLFQIWTSIEEQSKAEKEMLKKKK